MPRRKLLLVDEDRVNCFLCSRIFQAEGFAVTATTHVDKTPELASTTQPDVIVMAVDDPDRKGLQTVARLKRRMETCDITVVGMLATLTPEECREAIRAGCIGCLGKRYSYPLSFMSPRSFKTLFYDLVPFTSAVVRTVEKTSRIAENERTVRDVFGKALSLLSNCHRPGSIVELSNGVVCMVKETHDDAPGKPVVEVLVDESGMHPLTKTLLDLRSAAELYIRTSVAPVPSEQACY